jgi:hypothetical protein
LMQAMRAQTMAAFPWWTPQSLPAAGKRIADLGLRAEIMQRGRDDAMTPLRGAIVAQIASRS